MTGDAPMPEDELDPEELLEACGMPEGEPGDDDETAALRPLFPDGRAELEPAWRELFGAPE